jgi:hypothetical protein
MVYLSTPCADTSTGKQCIKKAIDALFAPQASDSLEGHLEETSENNKDLKPTVIWSCVYVQEITEVNFFYHHYRLDSCSLSTEEHLSCPGVYAFFPLKVHCPVLQIREHLVLYCRALHLMNIWTTGVYWIHQKRYCIACCIFFWMYLHQKYYLQTFFLVVRTRCSILTWAKQLVLSS